MLTSLYILTMFLFQAEMKKLSLWLLQKLLSFEPTGQFGRVSQDDKSEQTKTQNRDYFLYMYI